MTERREKFRIGKWEIDPDAGTFTKEGDATHVPPRLMKLLLLLSAEAGATVSREALIDALWPRGYVNEEALSRAVNELRGHLGDNARAPEYIQTIPKNGYRLIAAVQTAEKTHNPSKSRLIFALITVLLAVLLLLFFKGDKVATPRPDLLSSAERLTAEPGLEWHPQISDDGQWVAQIVARDGRGTVQLFPTTAPRQTREIRHPDGLFAPAFSPDSSQLAVFGGHGENCRILLWPVVADENGDSEYPIELAECFRRLTLAGLDWSPDGEWLVYPDHDPISGENFLKKTRLADGTTVIVTRVDDPYRSDERPRFSPDGQWLSFTRGTRAVREIWLLNLLQPDSGPEQLTRDGQYSTGHDWWPDSQSIIFDSDRSGHRALWQLSLDGEISLLGARDAQQPSVSKDGSILFQIAQYEANIWALDVTRGELSPQPLIASTKYDSMPVWSPDGSEFAFTSNRSGDCDGA